MHNFLEGKKMKTSSTEAEYDTKVAQVTRGDCPALQGHKLPLPAHMTRVFFSKNDVTKTEHCKEFYSLAIG